MNYNKLSLSLLGDAFSAEECRGGTVFAVFAQEETVRTVRDFIVVLGRETMGRTLFGVPFVIDNRVPDSALVLGVLNGKGPFVDSFEKALAFYLTETEKARKLGADYKPPGMPGEPLAPVWGSLVRLT